MRLDLGSLAYNSCCWAQRIRITRCESTEPLLKMWFAW